MPRQNRVLPTGEIVAIAERGTLMGNRGVLHDEAGLIVRPWQTRRWIACRTEFRGRWRPIMAPRRWTELFFLDEATALAAGHRPCAHCRHADYQRFKAAWLAAHDVPGARAETIDRALHADRIGEGRGKRTHLAQLAALPDGAIVELEGAPWLVLGDRLARWSPAGYGERRARPARARVAVLTPRGIVAALQAGFEPGLHPSAPHSLRAASASA